MSADVSQLRSLAADLRAVSRTTQPKVKAAVRKTLFDIERDAKLIAFQKGVYEFGNLIASISTTVDPDGMGGEVGPTVEYGIYQELGTSVMAGRPYLAPAFDRNSPQLAKALASLGVEALF